MCVSVALTGSEGVSVLTFYLLEFVLAVSVEGSEEKSVPNPVTPTSPIPDTPPRSQRLEVPSDSSFYTVACVCVLCVSTLPVFAMRGGKISSLLPGQTFPVCKHWRARDTTVS